MNSLEFVASLVDSLAWPASVLVLVFVLRKQLPSLIRSLRRLRYKDLELEFERSSRAVAEKAETSLPAASRSIEISGQSQEDILERLSAIAEVAPRSAILEAWLVVEAAAIDAARKSGVSDFRSHPGPMRLRDYLVKADLLNQSQKAVFEDLRVLRNEAVHAIDAEFTRAAVDNYVETALRMATYLEERANAL